MTKTDATLGDGLVFVRNYAQRGCTTTLDAVDDTNVMDNDFATGLPVPRNNASAPTEVACFNTQITGGPQGKTRDRTPKFKFASSPAGAPQINCGVDDPGDLNTCTSPFTLPKQSFGRHTFYAAAVNSQNGQDPTPAERSFKVVRRH